MSLRMALSSTDSISAPHQYTFQLNPSNCTWILFFTVEMRFRRYAIWNTERPLCCFSSQLGFLLNRIDPPASELLSQLFQLFPSPLSLPEHTFCPQLLSLVILCGVACHSGRRRWTEKRSLGVGFQFSGPRGGFPFKNVSPVNMSPGWKAILWKTGRMFLKPAAGVCLRTPSTPTTHTHRVEGEASRSPAQQRYCLSTASSPGVFQPQFSALALHN